MSRYLKTIVIFVVLVVLSFFYAHIDSVSRMYDKNIDANDYTIVQLNNKNVVEQTFCLDEKMIDGFDIMFTNINSGLDFEINYEIKENNHKIVATGKISTKKLKTDRFFKVRFPQVSSEKEMEYNLKFSVDENKENASIGISQTRKTRKDTNLFLNGEETTETLILKIISHRFDVETFVVLLSFILFIIFFMKSLYKLFNE